MPELVELTAVQLLDGYRKGEFSPVPSSVPAKAK
jgi:aspartyl-tRNA(Asn)/glutamyl-tRNA(Gln) amidotransferase subunit A